MDEKQVYDNWRNRPDPEETIQGLKKVIWEAYGEVTNGRYVDRWIRTKEILENGLEEYGYPLENGPDEA